MGSRPWRRERALLALALTATVAGCGSGSGADDVVASTLPAHAVRTPPGPAYVSLPLAQRPDGGATGAVVVAGARTAVEDVLGVDWLADGRLLVQAPGPGAGVRLVDPATGDVLARAPGDETGDWGVTPEAVTLRSGWRLVVRSPDLTDRRVIDVDPGTVEIDGEDEEETRSGYRLSRTPYTLDGVTWVQWGDFGEYSQRADRGVLRVEDGRAVEVLAGVPVVSLVPSSDGAALLVLRQRGEGDDCDGCGAGQEVVEVDPATGEVVADYGMPDGYDPSWRVEALDKVGRRVVVRVAIGEAETRADPGVTRRTWVLGTDGWRRLPELDDTRTSWQHGGRLTWSQVQTRRDVGEGAAFRLVWTPDAGPEQVLVDGPDRCPVHRGGLAVPLGAALCPFVVAPGSLLPRGERGGAGQRVE